MWVIGMRNPTRSDVDDVELPCQSMTHDCSVTCRRPLVQAELSLHEEIEQGRGVIGDLRARYPMGPARSAHH